VAAAIQINREVGGELARVLENIAETIRGRMRLQRQVQTLTAEGRLSAYILIVLPMGLAAFLIWRDPSYFEPFASPIGVFLVVLAIVLLLVGWLWMRAMIRRLM
jgi:tight adherence protein B